MLLSTIAKDLDPHPFAYDNPCADCQMNPWLIYPTWQHFSSLSREVVTVDEEQNEWLRFHHLTAALYFAISFIEALLNEKYRKRLESEGRSEEEILAILRRGSSSAKPKSGRSFDEKFSEWPSLIAGKETKVSENLSEILSTFNGIRGNLTHPKSRGYDHYAELEKIDGAHLLGAVAEYAVTLFAGVGECYPYWLFGWNYLNPGKDGCDPFLINDQQFLHSLDYLGMAVPSFDANAASLWREANMKSFQGYQTIAEFLAKCRECEPFDPQFPLRPRLVKKWWDKTVFERNKDFIKQRWIPIGYGLVKVAPVLIGPVKVFKTSSPGPGEKS
jgi:hypothetical protein